MWHLLTIIPHNLQQNFKASTSQFSSLHYNLPSCGCLFPSKVATIPTSPLFDDNPSSSAGAVPADTNPHRSGPNQARPTRGGSAQTPLQDDGEQFELVEYPPIQARHDVADREARLRAKRDEKRRWLEDQDEMKFSHSIQFNAVPDWSSHYIAYSNLKKLYVLPNLYAADMILIDYCFAGFTNSKRLLTSHAPAMLNRDP